jgi:hypothetical protein
MRTLVGVGACAMNLMVFFSMILGGRLALAQTQEENPFLSTSTANEAETSTAAEATSSGAPTEHFNMDIVSTELNQDAEHVQLTNYIFSYSHEFSKQVQVIASVPVISGVINDSQGVSEIGNPFLGAGVWFSRLFPASPLWLGVHGGMRFPNSQNQTVATAQWTEYEGGAMLNKELTRIFDFEMKYTYISKTAEAEPGLDVGDEQDGYAALVSQPNEDWTLRLGVIARHADALHKNGEIIAENALYTAILPEVIFHLSENMDISARVAIPFANQSTPPDVLRKRERAFGDLVTRSSLDRSWSMGVGVTF